VIIQTEDSELFEGTYLIADFYKFGISRAPGINKINKKWSYIVIKTLTQTKNVKF